MFLQKSQTCRVFIWKCIGLMGLPSVKGVNAYVNIYLLNMTGLYRR